MSPLNVGTEGDLDYGLYELDRATRRLRLLGLMSVFTTALNIGIAISGIWTAATVRDIWGTSGVPFLAASLSSLVIALFCIITYDQVRKRATGIYDEVTDELEWYLRHSQSNKEDSAGYETPRLKARLILREFARSTDLPLVSGKQAPGLYAFVNIFTSIIVAFVLITQGTFFN